MNSKVNFVFQKKILNKIKLDDSKLKPYPNFLEKWKEINLKD